MNQKINEVVTSLALCFCRYCSRSCLIMMTGVGVAHKLLKKIIQILDKGTSVETIYKQSSGTGIQAMSLPKARSLYFGLKPIYCLHRDCIGCKSIPSCNCPGEEGKFQSVCICIRTKILKGLGSGDLVLLFSLLALDRYLFLSMMTR